MAAEKIKPQQIHRVKPKTQTKTQKIHELIEAGCHKVTTIAKAADCNHALVSRVLSRYNIEQDQVDGYKRNRADILAGLQHRIISSITDEDIQKAPMGSRVLAAAQLYDKERLERGQGSGDKPISINPEQVEYTDKLYEMMVDKETTDIERLEAIRSLSDYRIRVIAAGMLVNVPQEKIAKFAHITQGRISKIYRAVKR